MVNIPIDQKTALNLFSLANGRTWKSRLNKAWMTGDYSFAPPTCDVSALQRFRNTSGPTGLASYRVNL